MKYEFLNSKDQKPIRKFLLENYGVEERLPYALNITPKSDVYAISREVTVLPLDELKVHQAGIYIGEWKHGRLRLSIEGAQIVEPLATKNTITISEKLEKMWLYGLDLPWEEKDAFEGFAILKCENGDILGSTRYKEERLINCVPKGRRIHE